MILYTPFWRTLKENGMTTYQLINEHGISSSTIDRLRKNLPVSSSTLERLCRCLQCSLFDIIEFAPD